MTRGKRRYLLALVENSDACEWCKRMWLHAPFIGYCDNECWARDKRAHLAEAVQWL